MSSSQRIGVCKSGYYSLHRDCMPRERTPFLWAPSAGCDIQDMSLSPLAGRKMTTNERGKKSNREDRINPSVQQEPCFHLFMRFMRKAVSIQKMFGFFFLQFCSWQ